MVKEIESWPTLCNWIVQYDDLYEMPMSVQGLLFSDWREFKKGAALTILAISSLDLKKKIVIAPDGQICKLLGKGKRSLILTDEEYMLVKKLVQNANDETLEDLGE